jgi:signal transduction histidine kinase
MSSRRWFRSLYSRIAFGFVATLAVLLFAQALLFLWLTGRFEERPQGQTPQQLADFVARELSIAMAAEPGLDLNLFVREDLRDIRRPFLIVLRDGRRASNRPEQLPPGFMERAGVRRGPPPQERTPGPPGSEGPPPPGQRGGGRGRGGEQPRRGPGGGADFAPVVVNDVQIGSVFVPPSPPTWLALEQYRVTLTWVGVALLLSGATIASLLIFRPAHNRIRSLEGAARALAAGRTDVRANEQGGDEVSTLAREFNRMADELNVRAAALAASDKARRQLLADVSHELMTPLTAIRGYVETLAMPNLSLDAETRARYLEIANRETYKLEAIIGDLLDIGRIEGSAEKLNIERVPIRDLFDRVVERHLQVIQDKHVDVHMEIADAAATVDGDPGRLEQALQNLAANAIRHMPDGGTLTLSSAREDADSVRIAVRDTGPGIPDEHLPHIFDRFYKVDASRAGTTIPSGSGLGLSIVQTIVHRHGGVVRASNAPGGGALFEVVLPDVLDKSVSA